ncbi:MAG: SHD1 domain-containing protein, partial [Planctomycetales bacterium]
TPVAEASAERIAELTGAAVARIKPQRYRVWTDAAGKFEIEAMLLGRRDAMVRLKRKDGPVIEAPIDQFSETDRSYLAQQHEP